MYLLLNSEYTHCTSNKHELITIANIVQRHTPLVQNWFLWWDTLLLNRQGLRRCRREKCGVRLLNRGGNMSAPPLMEKAASCTVVFWHLSVRCSQVSWPVNRTMERLSIWPRVPIFKSDKHSSTKKALNGNMRNLTRQHKTNFNWL